MIGSSFALELLYTHLRLLFFLSLPVMIPFANVAYHPCHFSPQLECHFPRDRLTWTLLSQTRTVCVYRRWRCFWAKAVGRDGRIGGGAGRKGCEGDRVSMLEEDVFTDTWQGTRC